MHCIRTIRPTWKSLQFAVLLLGLGACAAAQQKQPPAQPADDVSPKIQLSFVNSCRPGAPEAEEMKRMLARVNEWPHFATDFEVARGLTTLTAGEARAAGLPESSAGVPSPWVRIRREFPEKALCTDAQYTLSVDGSSVSENLALHLRNTDEALQILISTEAVGSVAQMVSSDTPPQRIQVERFGKSSLVLARCANYDQKQYEPIFQAAAEVLRRYRGAMAVKTLAPAEMARLPLAGASHRREAGEAGSGRSADKKRH